MLGLPGAHSENIGHDYCLQFLCGNIPHCGAGGRGWARPYGLVGSSHFGAESVCARSLTPTASLHATALTNAFSYVKSWKMALVAGWLCPPGRLWARSMLFDVPPSRAVRCLPIASDLGSFALSWVICLMCRGNAHRWDGTSAVALCCSWGCVAWGGGPKGC